MSIHSHRHDSLLDSESQIIDNFLMAIRSSCQKTADRKEAKEIFFLFQFVGEARPEI